MILGIYAYFLVFGGGTHISFQFRKILSSFSHIITFETIDLMAMFPDWNICNSEVTKNEPYHTPNTNNDIIF